ncbi:MAG: helix-turn-helix domain-containing protein [Candidatus Uhrbacteria bacterium]
MIDKNIRAELISLGLAEKEAKVYLALIPLGTVGSSKLIEASELHGQFVYQALESLEARGLVGHVVERGRKKFFSRSPSALVQVAEKQVLAAQAVAKSLERAALIPANQTFEVVRGTESFVAHEFSLLRDAPEACELLVIGGAGDQFLKEMGEKLGSYEVERRKKKIRVRYVGSQDQVEALRKDKSNRGSFSYRVLPSAFTGLVNTNIWPEVVNLNAFAEPVTSFVLHSPTVAESYRGFFEALWKMGKE